MRKVVITALTAAVTCACSESTRTPAAPTEYTAPLQVQAVQPDGIAKNHGTHLTGDEEPVSSDLPPGTPTPADSPAQGQAIFQIAADGSSFDYKLIASNIENISMAHIHCGPVGMNGPIIVWLYPSPTATAPRTDLAHLGRHDGVLAEGRIVSGMPLHVRPLDPGVNPACPAGVLTFADVLAQIRNNNTYVNVHTNDDVAPTGTGPGDFPGGEIRGQLDKN